MWRSLVAHLTGGQGVAGSNPVIPTNFLLRGHTEAAPRRLREWHNTSTDFTPLAKGALIGIEAKLQWADAHLDQLKASFLASPNEPSDKIALPSRV